MPKLDGIRRSSVKQKCSQPAACRLRGARLASECSADRFDLFVRAKQSL